MVHARVGRSCTWSPPPLSIPILRRTWRLPTKYQHNSRYKHRCSYWHQWAVIHHHNICTDHISAIAIPKLIFRRCLVHVPEVVWPEIQGSRTRRGNEICERLQGTRTDATCNGRDGKAQEPRCTGDPMAD